MQLLESGAAFFPALERAIDNARHCVRLETYIFHDDASGQRIAQALARAAARGVEVCLVVDGFGTGALQGEVARRVASAPIAVRVFRPWSGLGLRRRALRRLHRKLALIDGQTAFVGGINLLDDQIDPVRGVLEAPRLDFALEVSGPLVAQVQHAMWRLWRELAPTGPFDPEPALPEVPGSGGLRAAFVVRDNWRHRRTIERAYLRALGQARREVLIACAYFFPGARFRRAMIEAAGRGVRVRLLLQGRIEYRLAHWGTLALYGELLAAGIEIIEYRRSFLHAKIALADDWVTVGSSNIDPFSLLLAREANVIVRDRAFAHHLRNRIEAAIAQGGERVRPTHLEHRPWWLRVASLAALVAMRIGVAVSGRGLRY